MKFDYYFLVKCIIGVTCSITTLIWLASKRVGWKDRNRYFNLQRYLYPDEKKLIRKYWIKIAVTIFAGGVMLLIVYFLHQKGILFPG